MLTIPRPIRAAVLSGVLIAGLAACGGQAAGESGDALSEVKPVFENALTVCTDMPYEPFEFKENGAPTGFDMDLSRKIADSLDLQFDVVDVSFDDITSGTALNDGECDLAVSAMSINGDRARVLDFSSPYFDAKQALITKKASGLTSLESLAGASVGVQAETTGETFLRDFAPAGTKIVTFEDSDKLAIALADGTVEAAFYDNTVSGSVVEANPSLRVVKEFDTGEQYGMAVKKDGNIPLLRKVNDTLAKLRANGEYDALYKKYF